MLAPAAANVERVVGLGGRFRGRKREHFKSCCCICNCRRRGLFCFAVPDRASGTHPRAWPCVSMAAMMEAPLHYPRRPSPAMLPRRRSLLLPTPPPARCRRHSSCTLLRCVALPTPSSWLCNSPCSGDAGQEQNQRMVFFNLHWGRRAHNFIRAETL